MDPFEAVFCDVDQVYAKTGLGTDLGDAAAHEAGADYGHRNNIHRDHPFSLRESAAISDQYATRYKT